MQIFTTSKFDFNKKTRTLSTALCNLGVAQVKSPFIIRSDVTGREIEFYFNIEEAERNEYWDGELEEFFTTDPAGNKTRVVIYRA